MPWKILTLVCLAAAIVQIYNVWHAIARIRHMIWKFGHEEASITAGSTMIPVFFIGTFVFCLLSALSARRLASGSRGFRRTAYLSLIMLTLGGIVWAALLSSPYVEVYPR